MRNHESVRCAAESSIGEKRDAVAETRPDNRTGNSEHFPHPRPAARPFIADDYYIIWSDLTGCDRLHRVFFAIVDSCRTAMLALVASGEFDHAAVGRESSSNNTQSAGWF